MELGRRAGLHSTILAREHARAISYIACVQYDSKKCFENSGQRSGKNGSLLLVGCRYFDHFHV